MRKVKQIAAIFFKHLVKGVKVSFEIYIDYGKEVALKVIEAVRAIVTFVAFTPAFILLPLIVRMINAVEEIRNMSEN